MADVLKWDLVDETHPETAKASPVPLHKTYVARVAGGFLVETWIIDGKNHWGGGLTFIPSAVPETFRYK